MTSPEQPKILFEPAPSGDESTLRVRFQGPIATASAAAEKLARRERKEDDPFVFVAHSGMPQSEAWAMTTADGSKIVDFQETISDLAYAAYAAAAFERFVIQRRRNYEANFTP